MDLPATHLEALKALAAGHTHINADLLAELRRWGLVMPGTLEVTGMGARYAGISERGVLE